MPPAIGSTPGQLVLPVSGLAGPRLNISEALEIFKTLPYRRSPLSSRNWGHARHSVCSYASKMKPGLAHTLVDLFTKPGDIVLDPFSGCGTLPFEACLSGRQGIGVDLSPLAHAITLAKVGSVDATSVGRVLTALDDWLDLPVQTPPTDGEEEIAEFFHPKTFEEIRKARRFFLQEVQRRDEADAFVLACVAHILHGNRPYALSRRSHGIIPIPPKGPATYKPLMVSLRDKTRRMLRAPMPMSFVPGQAIHGPAEKIPLPDGSIDAVITSPPFLGTTEFIRQNRLRLWFVGWDYGEQKQRKPDFLEYARGMDGYLPVLHEMKRVVRTGGTVVFHLGVVKGFDMAEEMTPLAEQVGFGRVALVYEDAGHLESHGRTDRGGTARHSFLFLQSRV